MDRFVWFVLLVVMSHLVTEFTRVTGYARGNRQDVVLEVVNDSFIQPKSVANMIFYPGEEYSLYDSQVSQYNSIYPNSNINSNSNNNNNNYDGNQNYNNYNYNSNSNYNNNNKKPNAGPTNAQTIAGGAFPFSFRPLIDSIFEIPISTLRAVNNLVARLTGSYQHQVLPGTIKSTNSNSNKNHDNNHNNEGGSPEKLELLHSLPNAADSTNDAKVDKATTSAATLKASSHQQHSATTMFTYWNDNDVGSGSGSSSSSSTNGNSNNNNSNSDKSEHPEMRLRRRSLLREVKA